jgi:hypothetical protein
MDQMVKGGDATLSGQWKLVDRHPGWLVPRNLGLEAGIPLGFYNGRRRDGFKRLL